MTEPGWYYAHGDPPGVERYWDGIAWVAETRQGPVQSVPAPAAPSYPPPAGPAPFYEPPGVASFPPPVMTGPPVDKKAFPDLLRVAAIVLSVLKAIPWLFVVLFAVLFASLASGFNDQGLDGWDDFFGPFFGAAVVLLIMLAVAGLLLILQFIGAIKRKPMMVFIPALIMALFDGAIMVSCIAGFSQVSGNGFDNDPLSFCYTIILVAAAQILVTVLALRAHLYKPE